MLIVLDVLFLAYFRLLVVKGTASVVLMIAVSTLLLSNWLDVAISLALSAIFVCVVSLTDKGDVQ